MAVAHYQFEAIHPFTDGNGRTGRVLNSLFLVEQGLLDPPILYLSRYIVARKADYYRLLFGVTRDGAWEPWLLYVLRGVEETARWTLAKIAAVRQLAAATVEYLRRAAPKVYSRDLVDVIFEQPYCRITNVVDRGIAKRETASRYLGVLVAAGVLEAIVVGRDRLFLHPACSPCSRATRTTCRPTRRRQRRRRRMPNAAGRAPAPRFAPPGCGSPHAR